MNSDHHFSATELQIKLKEAQSYQSMGLLDEALGLYKQVFSSSIDKDARIQELAQQHINQLEKDLSDWNSSNNQISAEDISALKSSMPQEDNFTTILDQARALQELGLFAEAKGAYDKLLQADDVKLSQLKADHSLVQIIKEYLTCLFKMAPLHEIEKASHKVIFKHSLNSQQTADIQCWIAEQMEKRDQRQLALSLYERASKIGPQNNEIIDRVNSLKTKISNSSRYDYLIEQNLVTTEQLQEALVISKKMNKSVEYVLIERFKIDLEKVGKSLSLFYGCSFRSFNQDILVPFELISKLKKTFLLNYMWVPISWNKAGIEVLIDDPKDLQKTDYIKALMTNQKIYFSVGIKEDIEKFIEYFFDPATEQSADDDLDDFEGFIPDVSFEEEEEIEENLPAMDEASGQVVKFVDQVLITAYRNNVSDIHVEPSPITRKTTIRFRTDGVCQEYIHIPNTMAPAVISRLKILADLDIAEKRMPQDGKIKVKRKGIPEFELRISTMPTAGRFEDAVLRILTRTGTIELDEIGLNERNLTILKKCIQRPYGMILCVGPTGSGKTTTLHAALAHINKPEIKIWTAEDPVEITQAGLRQVQVTPKIGLDFATIMRGFLRLDPDVIMIGEMRDKETASTAIEASLTGHLVLSTLHTNNAPETLTRMLDMGMNPINISDAFLIVLAQRLVRKLCKDCVEPYHPAQEEFDDLKTDYGQNGFKEKGIEYDSTFKLYRGKGCEKCGGSGYKGRMGIHELIEGTPEIKWLIKKLATSQDLAKQAVKDGMTTLKQDGIHKVIEGVTDIDEVRRVCVT